MSEREKRDQAIARVRRNPNNNYKDILDEARRWIVRQATGETMVAGQVFRVVLERRPDLKPDEKRVMGAVMRRLEREQLIKSGGISTRERAHKGLAREWIRIRT